MNGKERYNSHKLKNKKENQKYGLFPITLFSKELKMKFNKSIFIQILLYLFCIRITKEEKIFYCGNEIIIMFNGPGKHKFISNPDNIQKICSNNEVIIDNNFISLNNDKNEIKIQFDLAKVYNLNQMFKDCSNLSEIDLSNFDSSNINNMIGTFQNCLSLTSINLENFNTSKVEGMKEMFDGCNNLESLNLSSFDVFKVKTMGYMFKGCKSLISLNLSNFNAKEGTSFDHMFEGCKNLKFLYLFNSENGNDKNMDYIFKETPDEMAICMKNEILNYLNNQNAENIKDGHYEKFGRQWANMNIKKSTENICNIPSEDTKTNDVDNSINPVIQNNRFEYCYFKNGTSIISETIISKKTDKIETEYPFSTNSLTDTIHYSDININMQSLLSNIAYQNIEYNDNQNKYQISTLYNQQKNSNYSFIDLSNMADCLKEKYNIDDINDLIIYKKESTFEGINIPLIEYQIYSKKAEELNLDKCINNNITIYIPKNLTKSELYLLNPESNFYNDICDKYTTVNKTDMTLFDRKNEYNNKNLSLCEYNCTFKNYDFNTSKIQCDCILSQGINRLNNSEDNLLNKIANDKNIFNLDVMQCSQVFSSKEDIQKNPGFFLLIFILVIFLIISIIFFIKGYGTLKNKIEEVIIKKFKNKKNNNKIIKVDSNQIFRNKKKDLTKRNGKINRKQIKKNSMKESKSYMIKSKNGNNKKYQETSLGKKNTLETNLNIYETDYELNNALYIDAKKYDKRSGCDYYYSLLKNKQIIIFSFLNYDDYNSGIIKKYFFFLSFALHYTINALFFNDSNMHQIFQDQGTYNFKYQFPFIIASSFFSIVILRLMLVGLVLTDKSIVEIKNQNDYNKAKALKKKKLKNMIIKLGIFFGLNLLLLVLFWYYLTCWNAIYENTKIYLIKNAFISFGISLIYPFIINIFPALLRMSALKNKKKEYLYKVSKIIQLL